MADFNSDFWNWYITIISIASILACVWLIRWMSADYKNSGGAESTGHIWDSDLTELNNPMPRWWLGLFYISIAFGGFYLLLYPGLGTFGGILGWTSRGAYEEEVEAMEAKVGPLFAQYQQTPIINLIEDKDALKIGERLYASYCTSCHGSDARGARGYPNLRDNNWLWGGDPQSIVTTITHGRIAGMPAWEGPLGGESGVDEVAQYVLSLSGRATIAELAEKGKARFEIFCVACHGATGTGNTALGAPNLTDDIWLYGGSLTRISQSIAKGRNGQMPAQDEFLGEAKIHLLAAYVYGLSQEK
jgi:cytochrome c oxidase cbb3-type subunit 3